MILRERLSCGESEKKGIRMMDSKPWLSTLTHLGFEVNAVISHGHGKAISFSELYKSLEEGTVLEDLSVKIPDEFDFSLFPPESEQAKALNEVLNQVAGGLQGRERRKVGVEESGLHLLVAFVFEAVQQGYWVKPSRS